MSAPVVKTIDVQCCKTRQGARLTELLSLSTSSPRPGDHGEVGVQVYAIKLRVDIERDSYSFQSHARIEKWDGHKWNPLAHIDYPLMQTEEGLHVGPRAVTPSMFAKDRDRLISMAKAIIL